ncbi:uncharacterized protein LOC127005125 isoform X2 [Eriocheir sinensis]|nr:uncharacterized protein LOC127005125 isoform X2 [Eriocheir sinensis]
MPSNAARTSTMLPLRLLLAVLAAGLVVETAAAYVPHAPVERLRRQLAEKRGPDDNKPVQPPGLIHRPRNDPRPGQPPAGKGPAGGDAAKDGAQNQCQSEICELLRKLCSSSGTGPVKLPDKICGSLLPLCLATPAVDEDAMAEVLDPREAEANCSPTGLHL